MPPKKGKAAAPKAPEPEVLPQGIADMEVPKATGAAGLSKYLDACKRVSSPAERAL